MYVKGKAFLGAALLLEREGKFDYVVLHLLCQGIEIVLKGLLLLFDYDKYQPLLKSKFGHHLDRIAIAAAKQFDLRAIREPLALELKGLSVLYAGQSLRYGTFYNILVDPSTLPCSRVWRRIAAVIRLSERELRRSSHAA